MRAIRARPPLQTKPPFTVPQVPALWACPPARPPTASPALPSPAQIRSTTEGGYAWNTKVSNSYNITDNLLWVKGKHNLTFGGQVVRLEYNYIKVATNSGPMGFTFSPTETGAFTGY